MSRSGRRRTGAVGAISAVLSTLVTLAIGTQPAGADTTQPFACFSPLTSTYATFPLPVTGSGSPDPILSGAQTSFTGVTVTLAIDANLVIAGIGAGVLTFVTDPALIGSVDPNSGGDGVNSAVNTTTFNVTASNTTAGTTALTGGTTQTFFVVWDGADPATLAIYVETSPGSWDGSGTDGLTQVPMLPVPIPVGPGGNPAAALTVTSNGGGNIALASALGPLPANPAGAPSIAERNAAPLILLNNLGVSANFYCWPGQSNGAVDPVTGLPASSPGFTPAASANAIDTVTVNIPPAAPTCTNETASAPAGQQIVIDLTNNCTDVNGDLDPASFSVTAPTAGTLNPTANPGVYTYDAPAADPGSPVTFDFTVDDLAGASSNVATASISILGNLCDATAGSCSLSQVLIAPVLGATRVMEQAGSTVTLIDGVSVLGADLLPGTADDPVAPTPTPIVLNGAPQLAVGNLNQITVTNARGDDAGWTVTGVVTPFYDGTIDPSSPSAPDCLASDDTTWSNHCIPGDNLGWQPSADVAHVQVLGDVAAVSGGSPLPLPPGFYGADPLTGTGMTAGRVLCSAPSTQSGGTFTCDAGLALSVPASAAAGNYTAVLTLTLA